MHEATELLQALIRNACVNDGTVGSGQEVRNADTLMSVLEGPGIEVERFEPEPARVNLVARIEGSDKGAPILLLHAHTDVVPADPDEWSFDPFAGDVVDGMVRGRGAIDLLGYASTIATSMRHLANQGFRPAGTLIFAATADQEAQSDLGSRWLVEHHPDAVRADYAITESGGFPIPGPVGVALPVIVSEKGSHWFDVRVDGRRSRPQVADPGGSVVLAAEMIRRIDAYRPAGDVPTTFRDFLEASGWAGLLGALLDAGPEREAILDALPDELALMFDASTRPILSTASVHGERTPHLGAPTVLLEVNVRTLPHTDAGDAEAMLREALGDIAERATITLIRGEAGTSSPVDTPLWEALRGITARIYPDGPLVPFMNIGGSDARFFRRLGAVVYGAGLYSDRVISGDFFSMIHGVDEAVDVESLALMSDLWVGLARDLLDP